MKPLLARLARQLIRWRLAGSSPASLLALGEGKLLKSFHRAARCSPAYRTLLAEAGIDPALIRTPQDFRDQCPVLDKAMTFKRFGARELLAEDIKTRDLASVLTSSGHGGGGFALGLSTRAQLKDTAFTIDLGLDLAFDTDRRRTLLINCLPMGVTFQSDAVCVANVSVREDMACALVNQVGDLFEQIVLCGDPLFLKKVCDHSQDIGLDWRRHRLNVIVGEETFTESFRDYLAGVLGIDPDDPGSGMIGSSMGVGELGLNLFNETRETVALRRACARDPQLRERLLGPTSASMPVPTFMVYSPLRTSVEILYADDNGNGDLVVTLLDPAVPLPLLRYKTGDRARFVSPAQLKQLADAIAPGYLPPALPIIALHGRSKDQLPGGGHVDTFKEALYGSPEIARQLSGAHRISGAANGLCWQVQAARGAEMNLPELTSRLGQEIAPRLPDTPLTVTCMAYDEFPHGKTIDYERKFVYWLTSEQ
jgi:phenylacetate-CoA ligase